MTKAALAWNVNQVAKAYANGTMRFDNSIQRGYVWDNKRASLLIDSCIRDYPIPAIYTIRTDEKITVKSKEVSVYDCIDGKQRCTTFHRFMNDEFALSGLEPYVYDDGTEYELNGKKFSDLDDDIKDAIKSYGLTVYYFTDITEEEVSEMMSRLNNGKVLTGTENARIKSKNLEVIKQVASHKLLMDNLSPTIIKGYGNEDIVIKLALLLNDQTELSSKNVKQAYEEFEFGEETISKLNSIIDFVYLSLDSDLISKKTMKRITSKANLITVLYVASQYIGESNGEYDDKVVIFGEKLNEFFNGEKGTISEEYNDACMSGTMKGSNVVTRNDELYKYIMAE